MPETRILVVDDEPAIRALIKDLFDGMKADEAENGEEALEMMRRTHYDVVLLDLWMPHVSGLEVLHQLSRHPLPHLPYILMISGDHDVRQVVQAMKLGADDFIAKPFDLDLLLEKTTQAIRSRQAKQIDGPEAALVRALKADIVSESSAMAELLSVVAKIVRTDSSVMISGESGVGKGLVARSIHNHSTRSAAPFVTVDCGSIPADLVENELFGHEKGSFTGASTSAPGKFEQANGGTLFLDEIGNLPATTQAKFLRVLQERDVTRLGGAQNIPVDFRLISATNANIESEVKAGQFREDLFFRINVVPLTIPALRHRREDIEPLADLFLATYCRRYNRDVSLHRSALDALAAYVWPGNVRELDNVIHRLVVLSDTQVLEFGDLPDVIRHHLEANARRNTAQPPEQDRRSLQDIETEAILSRLKTFSGNITRTAESLGISRRKLHYRLKELGLSRLDVAKPSNDDTQKAS